MQDRAIKYLTNNLRIEGIALTDEQLDYLKKPALIAFLNENSEANRALLALLRFFHKNSLCSTEELTDHLKKLSEHDDPGFVLLTMVKLVNGFGKIDYETGLIIFAERGDRKDYEFNPTLLQSKNFAEYLQALTDTNQKDFSAKFSISGEHWLAGVIQFTGGKVNLLLMDSLGANDEEDKKLLNCFFETFGDKVGNVYYSSLQRLRGLGCSIFSIDDVSHLFTVEKYLPPEYDKDLFSYLKANVDKSKSMNLDSGLKVNAAYLPLPLIRAAMTRDLLTEYIPARSFAEKELRVNKRGETAMVSAGKHFIAAGDKQINGRLIYKLNKMAVNVLKYLLSHTHKFILAQTEQYTLAGMNPVKKQNRMLKAFGEAIDIVEINKLAASTDPNKMQKFAGKLDLTKLQVLWNSAEFKTFFQSYAPRLFTMLDKLLEKTPENSARPKLK